MNNWKIGTRLGAGFAVVILVAVVLGMSAYAKVGVLDLRVTADLTNIRRAVKSAGPRIDLDANGAADSRDREFAAYQE